VAQCGGLKLQEDLTCIARAPHGPGLGRTSRLCWGTMRTGHKADSLQRRRRRIKFIAAPCVAVVLIYVLAGSPTVPPLRRSTVRSRNLLLLDTPQHSDDLLQQHLVEQPQRTALMAGLQQAVRHLWHRPPAADAMHTELATCLADAAPVNAAAAYTIDDFVAGRPARCTLLLAWSHKWPLADSDNAANRTNPAVSYVGLQNGIIC
jgi:hypothetical protein